MKKTIWLLFSAALVLASCKDGKNGKKDVMAADSKDSEKSGSAFTITAPAGWEKSDTTYMGQKIIFIRHPRENESDMFMENANVVSEKVGSMDLNTYLEKNITNMESGLGAFVQNEVTDETINGNHFKKMSYSHNYGGLDIDADAYFVIHDGTAYVITCSVSKGDMAQYRDKFNEILSSFKFN